MTISVGGVIPYRRLTQPLMLDVAPTSGRTAVPAGFIPPEATSFRVTNPNAFAVRLRGAKGSGADGLTITTSQGWLFPPGFSGTFTTEFPEFMATISQAWMGTVAGSGILEISYGIGGGGESVAALAAAGGSAPNGNVNVTNFPAVQPVSDNNSSLTVDGSVAVSNFPTTQAVSGTVSVSNLPTIQQVGDNSGSLTVDTPQLPTTLGAKTSALSASVVLATDQASIPSVDRGSATMTTGQIQVNNTTAVQVVAARANRRSVTLAPSSQFTYFVGNSGVTASTGLAVLNGGAVTLPTTSAVFVVAQSTGPMTFVEHY